MTSIEMCGWVVGDNVKLSYGCADYDGRRVCRKMREVWKMWKCAHICKS